MSAADEHGAMKCATDEAWAAVGELFAAQSGLLREEDAKITARREKLEESKAALARENGGEDVSPDDVIRLNVGGELVTITRGTLTLFEGTRFEALFSGRWENKLLKDPNGCIFLDVHPGCFKKIVDYHRRKKMAGPDESNAPELPYLDEEEEAEIFHRQLAFFGLDEVIAPPCRFDSTIITETEHFRALSEWMAEDDIFGEPELLYRATTHGWTSQNFHQLCDNKGATLTVIKTTGNFIFGGFISDPWMTHGQWCGGSNPGKTFLYALQCHSGLPPTKMPHKPGNQQGGYHHKKYGPAFGSNRDIQVNTNSNTTNCTVNIGGSYELPAGQHAQNFLTGSGSFTCAEIEVYRISLIDEGIPGRPRGWRPRAPISGGGAAPAAANEPWQTAEFTEFTPAVNSALTSEQAALVEAKEELIVQEKRFAREKGFIEFFAMGETKDIVTIVCSTVADRPISVKLSTLTQVEDSMLAAKFRECWTQEEAPADDPRLWDVERVIETVLAVKGVPESIADKLRAEEIDGDGLLALQDEDLKELGGTSLKMGARALLKQRIKELGQVADGGGVAKHELVEYGHYSFCKIVDQLRLRAMCQEDDALPPSPFVKEEERSDFKNIVEYFFPGTLAATISDFKYTPKFVLQSSIISSPAHLQHMQRWMAEDDIFGSFKLLYRATTNGWTAQNFHQLCDNKGATLTVIKTQSGNAIFGGFISDPWATHGQWCGGSNPGKTFLYALQCHSGLPPTKMPHKPGNQQGGYHHNSYGPTFGGANDIRVQGYSRCGCCNCGQITNNGPCPTGCCSCNVGSYNVGSSYELPAGQNAQNFLTGEQYIRPTEVEVFQLITA